MKHLLYLLLLTLFVASCSDGLVLPETPDEAELPGTTTEEVIPETNPEIEEGATVVHFSDKVLDDDMQALAGVHVSVFAANLRYSDITDANGTYNITVPLDQLPTTGYISMSITKDNFKPKNVTYQPPLVANTVYDSNEENLSLSGCPTCLDVGGYKSSELFHLGDDNYGGTINSQFQKSTDGIEMPFELKGAGAYSRLRLSFEAKGLQPTEFPLLSSVQFGSGGEVSVEEELDQTAPEDGSFGTYTIVVDNSTAITDIKFITRNHGTDGSDYDDWEFTCLYVEGI